MLIVSTTVTVQVLVLLDVILNSTTVPLLLYVEILCTIVPTGVRRWDLIFEFLAEVTNRMDGSMID